MPPSVPPGRRAGRLPTLSTASSRSGVQVRKYGTKSGRSRTMERYEEQARSAISSMRSRQAWGGSGGGVSDASSTAVVYSSRLRTARPGSPNFAWIISPCSVTRRRPATLPGGCARMAWWVGPPPRPTVPPRPWKSVTFTPWRSHAATMSSWPRYSAQAAASRPASLAESE